jgi:SAM-dependent methyltransferase
MSRNLGADQSVYFAEMFLEKCPKWFWEGIDCLLDAGCSGGDGTDAIRRRRGLTTAWGVDHDRDRIEVALSQFPQCNFMAEDLLLFRPPTFPVVYCSNVIEHYHDPYPIMRSVIDRAILRCAFVFPLNEVDLIPGHLCSLTRTDFPNSFHGTVLAFFEEVDCSKGEFWGGSQGIAIYSRDPSMVAY